MSLSPLLDEFIAALRCLPGIGPKSAQRMAYHLLQQGRQQGQQLVTSMTEALNTIGHCQSCRTLCETQLCNICQNPKRDQQWLCIVESPIDSLAIEQTAYFNGHYFILLGHLSPLDGIGPNDIGCDILQQRLQQHTFREIIIATNPTVEGEATAHYLSELIKPHHIHITRIAAGVPMGGELEYTDRHTLSRALASREAIVD